MHLAYLISVWIHIFAAALWIGGSGFLALVMIPAVKRHDPAGAPALLRAVALRFRIVGWSALAALVATGALNLRLRGFAWESLRSGGIFAGPFGGILALKLSLFALLLLISGAHDFILGPRAARIIMEAPDSVQAAAQRRLASRLGRFIFLLSLAILAAAVMLVRGGL